VEIISNLATWSVLAFGLVLFAIQICAFEVGSILGRRYSQYEHARLSEVGVLVGAMLGLLTFVLALTLSSATARYAERRAGTLAEANAIGTAWLRAEAIGHPRGSETARLLVDYAKLRASFVRAPADQKIIADINDRTQQLQTEIWGHVSALVREKPDAISSSLMAAINETFDMSTAIRFAFDFRIPSALLWILIGMAFFTVGGVGFQLGAQHVKLRPLTLLLMAMWTVILVAILDLSAARIGDFQTAATVYDWTISGMADGVVIRPLPAPR